MKEQNAVYAGLVNGCHELPTDLYIFDKIDDPTDFDYIQHVTYDFITSHCGLYTESGFGINQQERTEVEVFYGTPLVVYVTGLSAALAAVIKVCAECGVPLILMHYDRESGDYKPQRIFY